MNTTLILTIFIGFSSLLIAFAVIYFVFVMIKDSRSNSVVVKQMESQQAALTSLLQDMGDVQKKMLDGIPASDVETDEETASPINSNEAVKDETNENNVSFNASQTKTLEEKYKLLPLKYQRYYDDIAKYAQQVEGYKVIKNSRYEEYKIASARLVRLLIKKGVVVAEFIFSNFDFKSYASENKVSVKQAPTTIKIIDEESVRIAKDSIDISLKTYLNEKEMKKELAKERRRAKRENQ